MAKFTSTEIVGLYVIHNLRLVTVGVGCNTDIVGHVQRLWGGVLCGQLTDPM